ncbi:MAG TPA: toluene-4-monooxygenase system B family protein [Nannocystaceae bacterium]|nr:toluene-4-monooxygenase system B family protein [Nannocystaceae bacterium]
MLVPLYGFLHGDTLGLVVLVHDSDRVRDIVQRLQRASAVRIAPRERMSVMLRGRALDLDATVAQAGLTALDRVDVVPEVEHAT